MYLQKHPGSDAQLGCFGINGAQQSLGIHAVYQCRVGKHLAHFIGLQMPYEMPFNVVGQCRRLLGKLCGAAFAKHSLSGIVGIHDSGGRMKLRHCHESHLLRQCRKYVAYVCGYIRHHSAAGCAGFFEPRLARYTSIRGVSAIDTIS